MPKSYPYYTIRHNSKLVDDVFTWEQAFAEIEKMPTITGETLTIYETAKDAHGREYTVKTLTVEVHFTKLKVDDDD